MGYINHVQYEVYVSSYSVILCSSCGRKRLPSSMLGTIVIFVMWGKLKAPLIFTTRSSYTITLAWIV